MLMSVLAVTTVRYQAPYFALYSPERKVRFDRNARVPSQLATTGQNGKDVVGSRVTRRGPRRLAVYLSKR